ncbi:uncharacterized protein LOC135171688 [Diachasmimorpha longicaudata]|uniref:uncharacterized protein LOC135171688 n=1 Tax=Diachasmimorpha longicaudata TaxID=58733 RepID=UPI0030B8CAA8
MKELREGQTQTSQAPSEGEFDRPNVLDPTSPAGSIVLEQLSLLAKQIEDLKRTKEIPETSAPVRTCENTSRITMKDALAYIPTFDGYNISVTQFMRSCNRACSMLNQSTIPMFLALIRQKFTGRARTTLENLEYQTASELESKLRDFFDPIRTANQYKAALENVCKKSHEHVVDYINRVRNLYCDVINAETLERECLSTEEKCKLEKDAINAFLNGLPPSLRVQCLAKPHNSLEQTFKTTVEIYKIFERDSNRFNEPENFIGVTQLQPGQNNLIPHHSSSSNNLSQEHHQNQRLSPQNPHGSNFSRNFNQYANKNQGNNHRNYGNPGYKHPKTGPNHTTYPLPQNFQNNQNYKTPQSFPNYRNSSNSQNYHEIRNFQNVEGNFNSRHNQGIKPDYIPGTFCELCRTPGHNLSNCRRLAFMNRQKEMHSKNGNLPGQNVDGTTGSESKENPSVTQQLTKPLTGILNLNPPLPSSVLNQ